jgi:hypothetical protein
LPIALGSAPVPLGSKAVPLSGLAIKRGLVAIALCTRSVTCRLIAVSCGRLPVRKSAHAIPRGFLTVLLGGIGVAHLIAHGGTQVALSSGSIPGGSIFVASVAHSSDPLTTKRSATSTFLRQSLVPTRHAHAACRYCFSRKAGARLSGCLAPASASKEERAG